MVQEAIDKHPEFSKLWLMMGQIEEQQGNIDKSRDIYNKGVSIMC